MTQMEDFMVLDSNGNPSNFLGKMIYYTIRSILIDRGKAKELLTQVGLEDSMVSERTSYSDAFFSATSDISQRIIEGTRVMKVYVGDNLKNKQEGTISRELVKEIVGEKNRYIRIGSFQYDKENKIMKSDMEYDADVDTNMLAAKAERLFELYKVCLNRNSINTIFDKIVYKLDSSKVDIHGNMYFVPKHKIEDLYKFEHLVDLLNENNLMNDMDIDYGFTNKALSFNSMAVVKENDEEAAAKQMENLERDFYSTLQKELEFYQERIGHFIENGTASEKVISKWLDKIRKLKEKKKNYENLFNKSLNMLNDEFDVISVQAAELQVRMKKGMLLKGNFKGVDEAQLELAVS